MGWFNLKSKADDHEYQRTFLSPYYLDNLQLDDESFWEREARKYREDQRKTEEMITVRDRDPEDWELNRRSLAPLFKVKYQRGYWVAGSGGDAGGSSSRRWVDGTPSDFVVAECMAPLIPRQGVLTNPITGAMALPNIFAKRKALVENGKSMEEVLVYEKLDQKFDEHAQNWELKWSNLNAPYDRGFTPIVNKSYTVVGHWGAVLGGEPRKSGNDPVLATPAGFSGSLKDALDNGVPVFVCTPRGVPEGWVSQHWFTTEHMIQVKTGPDGEVMTYQLSNTGHLVEPWYSPMDLYYIGKAMVSLAKAGAKLTLALLSKKTSKLEARALLSGPSKKLAKEGALAGKTSPGMAVSTSGAIPASHSGRRTIIMGADMAEISADMAHSHPESGFYDVVIHGDSTSFGIFVKSNGKIVWKEVSVRDVASIVRAQLRPGEKIRLLSCQVGNTGGPAQQLATELNRTVWASTTTLNTVPKQVGNLGRKTFVPVDGGKFHEFLP